MTCFEQAFSVVVGSEGGYDVTRSDPGNWTGGSVGSGELRGTNFGISAAAYPTLDIASLRLADAQALYRRDYWTPVAGDRLEPALALLVFDAAVNNGVARSAKWLQLVVGSAPDGLVGDQTLQATTRYLSVHGASQLCAEFMARRLTFMAALPTWSLFGQGWARRLCALPWQSISMVAAPSDRPAI